MKYDFNTVVPRRGTDSLKWELADEDVLPMWVADMDFKTAPPVIEALVRRCEHGIFGYTNVPEEYYEATINWFGRRHNWKIGRDWITPIPGIVPALTLIIKALCERADWRRRIRKEMSVNEMGMVSPLGVDALIAAYNEGEEWLEELNVYISENYRFMKEFCAEELPLFPITEMEGTYLVWMDCSALSKPSDALADELKRDGRLWLNAGTMYGEEGHDFLRWNIACPRSTLLEGLTRFRNFVK